MELGLVLTLCGLGVAFWIPALIIAFYFTWQKEELYHEYNRPGDSN